MDPKAFIESSELHVVVPQSTRAGIEDLFTHDDFKDENARTESPLGIGERSLLHFGPFIWDSLWLLSSYSFIGTPR